MAGTTVKRCKDSSVITFGDRVVFPSKTIEKRFWPYVEKSGDYECWPWKAFLYLGYGRFYIGKDIDRNSVWAQAHRVSWELTNGKLPSGLVVRHRCDSPPCCNPDHLESGTQLDNIADMVSRGRSLRGHRHWNCKLTLEQIHQIRDLRSEGLKLQELGDRFSVSVATISRACTGISWVGF